nr:YdaS family helix-turn-helix protein [Achromobacter xylosoxidans]
MGIAELHQTVRASAIHQMMLATFIKRCNMAHMDKLKDFLKPLSLPQREAFAASCGTTWPFLRNVMYGQRTAGEKLCVAIERESGRAVTRQDMREDWREIWPELPEPAPAQQEAA